MIQVNRIYLIFNRLVTKKFLVDTSDSILQIFSKIQHFYAETDTFSFERYLFRLFYIDTLVGPDKLE